MNVIMRAGAVVLALSFFCDAAIAQDYPTQPVKLVVPFPAGGGTDALGRWFAKSKPGELSYASAGIGTQHHVNAELLKTLTGISLTHVPYRGGGPALQDVVAGHVPIYVGDVSTVMTLARTGKVRALALTISQRLETWPEIPTMQE